jgi:hypothetical protein
MDTAQLDTKSKNGFQLQNRRFRCATDCATGFCATLKSIVFGAYLSAYQSSAYRVCAVTASVTGKLLQGHTGHFGAQLTAHTIGGRTIAA